ncbi:3-hydroxyacyl-ACP dehydratase FabZ [Thermopetrobacter sp. TC1]|uniref:3-hydroxyacyl-ACP dehydratase FabZ n=1 Tax=Thermopetrobacter sp. TC1 TaxID=1495045 RepID=UPI000570568D|nr:3-hydroxyacyl-ACP dehydratase FabZ [Thermopetrobacter sp. TC1]
MSDNQAALDSADIQRIMEILPHRFPMLLIDRVEEMDGESSAVGIKNVTATEPFLAGHFPGKPVFPGVLLLEAMAQTAGVMVLAHKGIKAADSLVYFVSIDKARFRKPVVPGDTVRFEVRTLKGRRNIYWFDCQAKVNGEVVAEAVVSAMLAEDPEKIAARRKAAAEEG